MKIIEAFAHILTSDGDDAKGLTIALEAFVISTQRWIKLVSVQVTDKGVFQAKVSQVEAGAFYAPQLRLTEGGGRGSRVLSQGGYQAYNTTTQTLSVDFGEVEQLEQSAYPFKASNSQFNRSRLTVAGQPKRAKITNAQVLTALAASIPTVVVPPVTISTGTIGTNVITKPPFLGSVVTDTFNAELLKFKAIETKLQLEIIQKDQLLAAKVLDINNNKTRIKSLENQLKKVVESKEKIKIDNQLFVEEAKRKSPIKNIAANIGAEIDAANRKMRSEKRPYQFGRIELDLRGTISTDGQSMSLINLGDLMKLRSGVTSPGVKMELIPEREQTEAPNTVKIPNVLGLTEAVTRRLLHAAGLQLESINKSIEADSKIPIGQSIQQSPKAGKNIPRGNTVLVVFTAPNSNSGE